MHSVAVPINVRCYSIVLQNSFWGCVKNFLGSLMRSPGNYVGGHMIDPISNRSLLSSLRAMASPNIHSDGCAAKFCRQLVFEFCNTITPIATFILRRSEVTLRANRLCEKSLTNACQSCAIRHSCTTGKERLISRWEHEAVLETVQTRLDQHPEKMTMRRQTAEHPFGTIKCSSQLSSGNAAQDIHLWHRITSAVSSLQLRHVACDALVDPLKTPLHLGLGEVLIARIDSLEFGTIDCDVTARTRLSSAT